MTEEAKQPVVPTVDLYIANDGLRGNYHPYRLDLVERKGAETMRAEIEGREPDYDNPGSTAGTVYVTASQLLAAGSVNAAAVDSGTNLKEDQALVKTVADSDASDLTVAATVPAEAFVTLDAPHAAPTEEETETEAPAESTPTATKTTTSKTAASSSSSTSSS